MIPTQVIFDDHLGGGTTLLLPVKHVWLHANETQQQFFKKNHKIRAVS